MMIKHVLGLAIGVALLAACASGQQVSPSVSGLVPNLHRAASYSAKKDCKGTRGVTVSPCPAKITTNPGPDVTVGGPEVVNASFYCENSGVACNPVPPSATNPLTWQLNQVGGCGKSTITATGYNAHGKKVGTFTEKVILRWNCQ